MDLKAKFNVLVKFSEQMCSFGRHICTLLTAARMSKFDAAWTEKLENLNFPH